MTEPDHTEDPLEFVRGALSHVPNDPSKASVEGLRLLAAIQEGLSRRALELSGQQAQLAMSVLCGPSALSGAALDEAIDERARLADEAAALRAADHLLDEYAADALRAHGLDLDALVAQAQGRAGDDEGSPA